MYSSFMSSVIDAGFPQRSEGSKFLHLEGHAVQESNILRLRYLTCEGVTVVRNVAKCWANDTESHLRSTS
jgi:hypothetical protein